MTDVLEGVTPSPETPLVLLTGAGISAESGIPTFRGPEGYWRVGSVNYRPEEMATYAFFERMPDEVWRWYAMRRATCRKAKPKAAHETLVALEQKLGDAFLLVTQNVDGLHARAGNSRARTYAIHGEIDLMRCADESCRHAMTPVALPDDVDPATLRCECGARMRPHVLWFDESYDEPRFRIESTLAAMSRACALVVIGTSGATTLPNLAVEVAARRGIPLVVIDPEETRFAAIAQRQPRGAFVRGTAVDRVRDVLGRFL